MSAQHPNHHRRNTAFTILVSWMTQFLDLLRQEVILKCSQQKKAPTPSQLIYHNALGQCPWAWRAKCTEWGNALLDGLQPSGPVCNDFTCDPCNADRYCDGTFPRSPSHRRGQRSLGGTFLQRQRGHLLRTCSLSLPAEISSALTLAPFQRLGRSTCSSWRSPEGLRLRPGCPIKAQLKVLRVKYGSSWDLYFGKCHKYMNTGIKVELRSYSQLAHLTVT